MSNLLAGGAKAGDADGQGLGRGHEIVPADRLLARASKPALSACTATARLVAQGAVGRGVAQDVTADAVRASQRQEVRPWVAFPTGSS